MTKVTRQRKSTVAAQVAAHAEEAAVPVAAPAPAAAAPAAEKKAKAAPAKAAKPLKAAKPAKPEKPAKPVQAVVEPPKAKAKLVRDSFTMPKPEYELLAQLKQRGTVLQRHVKKSELLRAGIAALAALPDDAFLAALDRVPSLKTGRPKAEQPEEALKG